MGPAVFWQLETLLSLHLPKKNSVKVCCIWWVITTNCISPILNVWQPFSPSLRQKSYRTVSTNKTQQACTKEPWQSGMLSLRNRKLVKFYTTIEDLLFLFMQIGFFFSSLPRSTSFYYLLWGQSLCYLRVFQRYFFVGCCLYIIRYILYVIRIVNIVRNSAILQAIKISVGNILCVWF